MRVELVTPCGHGSLEPHPSDNYNLPTEMCSPSRSTVSGFSPEAVQAAAKAIEAEAKKWPQKDHPLGWSQRVPPPGATMQELATAALAAAWATDFGGS